MFKFRSYIVILFLVMLLSFTGLSCGKQQEVTTTPTPTSTITETAVPIDLSTIDPTTINTTFSTNYSLAKQKANEWKGDAYLASITVKLPIDLSLNNATETYVFGSQSDPDYWWTMSLAESTNKYIRAIIPKTDYLGNVLPQIPEKYWKTNYLQAFQAADLYQGAAFRASNANTEISVTLSVGDPKGWLWWTVEYKSSTGNSLKIRINASDLKIYDDQGNIIQTGTSISGTPTPTSTSSATPLSTSTPTATPTSTQTK